LPLLITLTGVLRIGRSVIKNNKSRTQVEGAWAVGVMKGRESKIEKKVVI